MLSAATRFGTPDADFLQATYYWRGYDQNIGKTPRGLTKFKIYRGFVKKFVYVGTLHTEI